MLSSRRRRGSTAGGVVIFVDQRLEVLQRTVALGAGQRRRQVIDDDGADAALGLRSLARIVDDERIEMRHRAEDGFRIAGFRQRQSLARQPFEIAVLAHMDDGMGAIFLAQVGVEGEIAMRRHEVRRMVGFLRIDIVAARRLDADQRFAEARQRQGEARPSRKYGSVSGCPQRAATSSLNLNCGRVSKKHLY